MRRRWPPSAPWLVSGRQVSWPVPGQAGLLAGTGKAAAPPVPQRRFRPVASPPISERPATGTERQDGDLIRRPGHRRDRSIELALLQRLVADQDRPLALAAVQRELGADLVERPAVICRDRPCRDGVTDLDAPGFAAVPVLAVQDPCGQLVGKVEVGPITDGGEAEVEAPVTADAMPQVPGQLDPEPDHERVG